MQSANNEKNWKYIKQNKFNILIILDNKICQKFADDNMIDNIDINIIKQEKSAEGIMLLVGLFLPSVIAEH